MRPGIPMPAISQATEWTEDGIAGDPPKVVWRRRNAPWEASRLERKNVVLLVLESARYDLLDARVNGAPVMPVLSSLPGERLLMFSHAGYTVPSLCAIFNGTVDEREAGISLVDRFRELGYQTAVFSGQYEGFGDISARTHMNRADVFVDASSFPREQRMYAKHRSLSAQRTSAAGDRAFSAMVQEHRSPAPFLRLSQLARDALPISLLGCAHPAGKSAYLSRRDRARETRLAEEDVLECRAQSGFCAGRAAGRAGPGGARSQTVILVVGDHGEELFDHGYLGHGTSISFEQNATIGKLINSNWKPPHRAFGLSSVSGLIHNALVRRPEDALPVDEDFFCYIGSATKPSQLGAVTPRGIVKFDFRKRLWAKQAAPGEEFAANPSFPPLIYLWESYLRQLPAPDGRGK